MYLVQRPDCDLFSVAADIDPGYAAGLKTAMTAGVEVLCRECAVSEKEITVQRPVPVDL